jgi:uncharacterized protein (TIGR03118 family)
VGFRPAVEALEDRRLMASHFLQTNLVSDIPGFAANTDPQLINPWGLTASGKGPFWVSDNQNGLSTLYDGAGNKQGLTVNIPTATPTTFMHATPTGVVFNTDPIKTDFNVTDAGTTSKPFFLFDTLDGTIDGWNGADENAAVALQTPGAVYTGLAIDTSLSAGDTLLYAADWGKNTVEVYNGSFQQVDVGSFQDSAVPKGFRPFNVQDVNGTIVVTYAKFDSRSGADSGTGGYVAEFSRDGVLQMTIHSPVMNSPWGVAQAPAGFGDFGGDLLIGNFGNGTIDAFDASGNFKGPLTGANGQPISIENLWALRFGNGFNGGDANTLYFTAGITDAPDTIFGATDGLLGSLAPFPTLAKNSPILPNLSQGVTQTVSSVPDNGDGNPYGTAFVPNDIKPGGLLHPGDLLVANFNDSNGDQGTGSSIVRIGINGQKSVFYEANQPLGFSTALGVLKSGFVLVGEVPVVGGVAQPGQILILDSSGNPVGQITNGLNGPWDLAIHDQGTKAEIFVANVLDGTVVRIDLSIPIGGTPSVTSTTQIASGYAFRTDPNALVVGPTGLALDGNGTLYIASTGDNGIFAIPHALSRQSTAGIGTPIVQNDPNLHGPLGLVIAPNGDLIVANGDAQSPSTTGDNNELAEFSPDGTFVGKFQVDTGALGAAFGIAVQRLGGKLRFAAVDDNTNSVTIWTFQS